MKQRALCVLLRLLLLVGDCAFNLAVHLVGWRQVQVPNLGLRWRKVISPALTLTKFREYAVESVRQYINQKPTTK